MMRDCSSVRLIWAGDRRLGRLAPGLPARCCSLGVARRKPGLILGLLPLEAFLGPRLDLGSGPRGVCQPLLAPRQFVGDRQAVGEVRPASALASNSATSA